MKSTSVGYKPTTAKTYLGGARQRFNRQQAQSDQSAQSNKTEAETGEDNRDRSARWSASSNKRKRLKCNSVPDPITAIGDTQCPTF